MPTISELMQSIEQISGQIKVVGDCLTEILDNADFPVTLGGMSTTDIAKALFLIKDVYEDLDASAKLIYHQKERLNKGLLPKRLTESGQDMIRVPTLGRSFSIRTTYTASMVDKEAAFEWLRGSGNGAIIQETVNAGTLASFCRSLLVDQGIEPPVELIKMTSYDSISINKYTPKPGAKE